MKNTHIAIGIDIGGSHISCGAVDLQINQLIPGTCFESKVDNKASADDILNSWVGAIRLTMDVVGKDQVAGIGFAMPGPFDYSKGIALFERVEKYLNLYGVHVDHEIRTRLGLPSAMPVRFINDATAFAVAEAWIGVPLRLVPDLDLHLLRMEFLCSKATLFPKWAVCGICLFRKVLPMIIFRHVGSRNHI